ncbi:DUF2878 domain-containing protein [Kineobactrum sediminis]|uniref:DUF2878 domain-containing protein n=1 Tax=Kineobactrum sediminis TaxID=1905677 RepID=A0A2N5Y5J8_9GAMM|nr:DUF2878 domain-containing protein [Kineobactrum sediminis]PLW83674.1 DUF2878 domain-containing protein [Kineobactrum sediminis]
MSTPITDSSGTAATHLTDKLWFNAIWFQSLWFCAVLGRDELLPATLAIIALHLLLVPRRFDELRQLAVLGGLGISVDAGLSLSGVFVFPGGVLVPLWLCCLWLAFATTLGRSLAAFGPRPWLAAIAGGVVVPLNYFAGSRLGAVEFGLPLWQSLLVMALIWSALLPGLYYLQQRFFNRLEATPNVSIPG